MLKRTGFASGFAVLFMLFWSGITGTFDALWIGMAVRQVMTWDDPAAPGVVVESRIERGSDSEGGATYDAKVTYEYTVAGRKYVGRRIRCMECRIGSGRHDAERNAAMFPSGKKVPVYYGPRDPSSAVLDRDFRGADFFLPLFMIPFNSIMLGGWYALVSSWRPNARPAGLRWREDGLKLTAFLYNTTPWAAAVAAAAVSSFVLVFMCGLGATFAPLDWLVIGAWLVVLGSALWAFLACRKPATTLEFDHFSGRILISKCNGQSHAFAASDIEALGVDTDAAPNTSGESLIARKGAAADEDNERVATYKPTLVYRNKLGTQQKVELVSWTSQPAVAWLARWLEDRLRLKN